MRFRLLIALGGGQSHSQPCDPDLILFRIVCGIDQQRG